MSIISLGTKIVDIRRGVGSGAGGGAAAFSTKSLDFDGIDDYLSCGIPTYLQSKTTATVSMWVRFTAVGNNDYTELLNVDGSPPDLRLRIVPAGTSRRIEWGVGNSFARATDVDFSDLVSGTWYHIMGCWNNSLNDGSDAQIYLDGDLIFQGDTNIAIPATITANMNIAGEGDWGPFGGNIDEIAIWNTDQRAEVSSVYNLGTPADLSLLTTPPNDWYRMGENSTFKSPQILMPENTNKDKLSNYSFAFDGISDKILFTSIALGTDYTISAWAKRDSTANMFLFGNEATYGYGAYFNGTTNLYFKEGIGIDFNNAAIQTALARTDWVNWVFKKDSGAGTMAVYVDGVLAQSISTVVSGMVYMTAIGASGLPTGTQYVWDGNIDEVAIFNTSSIDLADIGSATTPKDLSAISGLTHWWKMGEEATFSTVWTVPDEIGSNDGTSANMDIYTRIGDATDSSNNALSYNMDAADIVEDVPPTP